MEQKIRQVELSVILECLGGRDLTKREIEDVKDFRNLAVVTTSKKVTTPKEKKKYFRNICRASSSVAAVAARASGQPMFVIKATAFLPETDEKDMAVDIGIFPAHRHAAAVYTYKVPPNVPYYGRCAWTWLGGFMKVTRCSEPTGFWFPPSDADAYVGDAPLLAQGDEKQTAARDELFKWAALALFRQQRTHIFAFYVAGPWVRVFRFDRAGCIVSPPFHVVRERFMLPNLLFRLFCASPVRQGIDVTATEPSQEDLDKLEAFTSENKKLLGWKAWVLEDRWAYPLHKVECPAVLLAPTAAPDPIQSNSVVPKTMSFLIGKPVASRSALTGRCTRGYVAYDMDNDRLVFLKDQWRSEHAGHHTELETYLHLHAHGVQYIATPIAGGDVVEPPDVDSGNSGAGGREDTPPQETLSHRYIKGTERRIHTRLVMKEIGRDLEDYENVHELLNTITFAIFAHKQAWEKAGVLHRDVSMGNIMIDLDSNKGFLNDWDLALFADELNKVDSEPWGAVGTWPFKSALSLEYPLKPPEVSDDVEAFINVVVFIAIQFHHHDYSPGVEDGVDLRELSERARRQTIAGGDRLARRVYDVLYEQRTFLDSGIVKGPWLKFAHAKRGEVPISLRGSDYGTPSKLRIFLTHAFQLIKEHYQTIDFKSLSKYDPWIKTAEDWARTFVPKAAKPQESQHNEQPRRKAMELPSAFADAGMSNRPRKRPTPPREPEPKPEGPGPLATHERLLDLLYWALHDPAMENGLAAEVKYVDQLRDLPAFASSHSCLQASAGDATGRKRKAGTPELSATEAAEVPISSRTPRGSRHGKRVRISENGLSYCVRVAPSDELPELRALAPSPSPEPEDPSGLRRSRRLGMSVKDVERPRAGAQSVPVVLQNKGKGRTKGKTKAGTKPRTAAIAAVSEHGEETTDTRSTLLVTAAPAPAARKATLPKEKSVKSTKVRAATKRTTKGAEAPMRRSSRIATKGL